MSMDLSKAIGATVRAHRERRRWTQRDLADATGLVRPNVARLENGGGRTHGTPGVPRLDTLDRVAAAFGLCTSELVYQSEVLQRMSEGE